MLPAAQRYRCRTWRGREIAGMVFVVDAFEPGFESNHRRGCAVRILIYVVGLDYSIWLASAEIIAG